MAEQSVIESLRAQIRQYDVRHTGRQSVLAFGQSAIDRALPDKGLRLGALHEVASGSDGAIHGAAATLFAAGILSRLSGDILWCLKHKELFAPALAQAGINMERVVFVDVWDDATRLACVEEGLRHGGLAGVVGEFNKCTMTASRRLQLAAESTGTLGLAIWRWRKLSEVENYGKATAARTCWRVTALPAPALPAQGIPRGKWKLELLRCRGGERASFDVEACDETGYLGTSSLLADRPDAAEPWQNGTFAG